MHDHGQSVIHLALQSIFANTHRNQPRIAWKCFTARVLLFGWAISTGLLSIKFDVANGPVRTVGHHIYAKLILKVDSVGHSLLKQYVADVDIPRYLNGTQIMVPKACCKSVVVVLAAVDLEMGHHSAPLSVCSETTRNHLHDNDLEAPLDLERARCYFWIVLDFLVFGVSICFPCFFDMFLSFCYIFLSVFTGFFDFVVFSFRFVTHFAKFRVAVSQISRISSILRLFLSILLRLSDLMRSFDSTAFWFHLASMLLGSGWQTIRKTVRVSTRHRQI